MSESERVVPWLSQADQEQEVILNVHSCSSLLPFLLPYSSEHGGLLLLWVQHTSLPTTHVVISDVLRVKNVLHTPILHQLSVKQYEYTVNCITRLKKMQSSLLIWIYFYNCQFFFLLKLNIPHWPSEGTLSGPGYTHTHTINTHTINTHTQLEMVASRYRRRLQGAKGLAVQASAPASAHVWPGPRHSPLHELSPARKQAKPRCALEPTPCRPGTSHL